MYSARFWLPVLALVASIMPAAASGPVRLPKPKEPDNPFPYNAGEPGAKTFSLSRGAEYLDGVARYWMRPSSCGACHANFSYVMARPSMEGAPCPLVDETRQFLERRKAGRPDPAVKGFVSQAEGPAIAFALAWHDAHTGGVLRSATREALARMWAVQRPNGAWRQLGCGGGFAPSENDVYYTACLAALATGIAPQRYAQTTEARDGMTKLRRYLSRVAAPDLHGQLMLLWASLHVEGLMTTAEREVTVKALLTNQQKDGGWSLTVLHPDPPPPAGTDFTKLPSDGYGTGFAIFVLRQAGVSAEHSAILRGIDWLRSNQRVSGRWFTPSPVAGHPTEGGIGARDLYIQAHGTAFAILALKACDVTDE